MGENRLELEQIEALAAKFYQSNDLTIVDYDLKPFSDEKLGYLGVHELLTVKVRDKTDKNLKTCTFFVKTILQTERELDRLLFLQETTFFSDVQPKLVQSISSSSSSIDSWCPKCYLATDNLLVMEDLRVQGFKVPNSVLSPDQLRSATKVLAKFHSASMILESKSNRPLSQLHPQLYRIEPFYRKEGIVWDYMLAGLEVARAVGEKLSLKCDRFLRAYETLIEETQPSDERINVLCHCDIWFNNLLFDDGRPVNCRMVDFQMVAYTCYAVDFVKFLYLSTDRSTRESLRAELTGLYHETLTSELARSGSIELSDKLSLERVEKDIEDKLVCGVVTAVQEFPIILMKKPWSDDYARDDQTFQQYTFGSRKEFVLRNMSLDEEYRSRIEEAVTELAEFVNI